MLKAYNFFQLLTCALRFWLGMTVFTAVVLEAAKGLSKSELEILLRNCSENEVPEPALWFQILRKLRAILQVLVLPGAFFVAGARRGQPYGFRFCESFAQFAVFGLCEMHFVWQAQDAAHFSWQALYESTNRKVGNAWKIIVYNYFLRVSNLMIRIFSCVFSAKVTVRLDFCGQVQYFVTFRLFSRGRATTSES